MPSFEVHPQWRQVLGQVLADAQQRKAEAVVAFDLDSTLLDNRPRQAALVHRYVRERGVALALADFDARHLHTGFDMRAALQRQGLTPASVDEFLTGFRPFWRAHFFTSEACRADVPVPGAPDYVRRAAATGAQLAYVTARPETMRPGTLDVLGRYGFPLPGPGVELFMKLDSEASDDQFKRHTHHRLAERGTVVAAFDNEPGHANDYRTAFPRAHVLLLTTGHSGRVDVLADGIIPIPNFQLEA